MFQTQSGLLDKFYAGERICLKKKKWMTPEV